jgi:isoquinoline 1-oxidoreductase beta subunit
VPLGFWRSVGQSISCFVVESAIDECAIAAGVDPYQYRRTLLAGQTSALAVLDAAAGLAKWSTPPATGHARGIALSPGFGSLVATVAELALVTTTTTSPTTGLTTTTTSYKVVSVCVAIDCGFAVNPDQVKGQIEGGVLHGMNAALWHSVPINNGAVGVRNFGNYVMGRMSTQPTINVTIVNQGSSLGGLGEAGVPGIAPAIANAYAALSGIRKRSLPLGIVTAPRNGD